MRFTMRNSRRMQPSKSSRAPSRIWRNAIATEVGERVASVSRSAIAAASSRVAATSTASRTASRRAWPRSRSSALSRAASAAGPGEVTKKNIGSESGWGDLPPKQREEAMQQIGRDFPSHYRDAIEEYFRKLAAEESSDDDK